jgi:hypothetical protein
MSRRPARSSQAPTADLAGSRQLPTIALKATSCASALDISPSSFLALVAEGKMPKPIAIPGHRGLVLFDFEAVRNAWLALLETGGVSENNPWDE